MPSDPSSFPLTGTRLRFECQAENTLRLGGMRAGANLRGALLGVMRRAACDALPGEQVDPRHTASCPVCWLAAANEHPGQERRGYTLAPPLSPTPCPVPLDRLDPGDRFAFHITLFGDALRYLPYFVLAVPEVGRGGVGAGRGRFTLRSITSEYPQGPGWQVMKEGETLVHPPGRSVDHAQMTQTADRVLQAAREGDRLRIDFLTPLRLVVEERLLKSPDFGALFFHLLLRLDELAVQHAGAERRPTAEREQLWNLANRVRLIESQARWEDVSSSSSRTGQQTWISGLVGSAWYRAPQDVWRQLLPWLLWGQIAQVGKDTAKGNGVFRLAFMEG